MMVAAPTKANNDAGYRLFPSNSWRTRTNPRASDSRMRSLLYAVLLAASADFATIGAYAAENPVLATAIRSTLEDSRTAVERTPGAVRVHQTLQAAYARHEFGSFWSRDGKASHQP